MPRSDRFLTFPTCDEKWKNIDRIEEEKRKIFRSTLRNAAASWGNKKLDQILQNAVAIEYHLPGVAEQYTRHGLHLKTKVLRRSGSRLMQHARKENVRERIRIMAPASERNRWFRTTAEGIDHLRRGEEVRIVSTDYGATQKIFEKLNKNQQTEWLAKNPFYRWRFLPIESQILCFSPFLFLSFGFVSI